MACPRSARKNLACRWFKQGPPKIADLLPLPPDKPQCCFNLRRLKQNAQADFPLSQVSQAYLDFLLFRRHSDMEKWRKMVIFPKSEELPARQRNNFVSLDQQKGTVRRDNQDIRPEGHENVSFSNSSFTCSSLNEVQQKFPHVKGWVVKKFTAIMFHKERPVTQHWTGQAYSILSQVVSC